MASFQTLAIILIGLVLVVFLFNSGKSRNADKPREGSIGKYYLKPMAKYWRKTLKIFLHFSGVRKTEWSEITVDELFDRVNSDQPPLLIDIRSPAEYNGTNELTSYGHIPNARSIPVLELESNLEDLESYKEKEIVTMCPGDSLSLVAVEIMTGAGFTDVKSLTGGTDAWHKKGVPHHGLVDVGEEPPRALLVSLVLLAKLLD